MANMLRLRTKAPPTVLSPRQKGKGNRRVKDHANGVGGRVGDPGEPSFWELPLQGEAVEWPLEALEAENPFDETFEEIGYGGFRRRRLPSADEQE